MVTTAKLWCQDEEHTCSTSVRMEVRFVQSSAAPGAQTVGWVKEGVCLMSFCSAVGSEGVLSFE